MAQRDDVVMSEAEFQRKVAAVNKVYGLVLNSSKDYLSTLDENPKPSIFRLQRYLGHCQHRLELLKTKKEEGFFGAFSNRPELTEIENTLEKTISKLQASKKDLEDRGYRNIGDLVRNIAPDTPSTLLLQMLQQLASRN